MNLHPYLLPLFFLGAVSSYGTFTISAHSSENCILTVSLGNQQKLLYLHDLLTVSTNFSLSTTEHCLILHLDVKDLKDYDLLICTYHPRTAYRLDFGEFQVIIQVEHFCKKGIAGKECLLLRTAPNRNRGITTTMVQSKPSRPTPSICGIAFKGRPGCEQESDKYVAPTEGPVYPSRRVGVVPDPVNLWADREEPEDNGLTIYYVIILSIVGVCVLSGTLYIILYYRRTSRQMMAYRNDPSLASLRIHV